MNLEAHKKIIKDLGGTFKVAKICGVKPPAVSYWKKVGIPDLRLIQLKMLKSQYFDGDDE